MMCISSAWLERSRVMEDVRGVVSMTWVGGEGCKGRWGGGGWEGGRGRKRGGEGERVLSSPQEGLAQPSLRVEHSRAWCLAGCLQLPGKEGHSAPLPQSTTAHRLACSHPSTHTHTHTHHLTLSLLTELSSVPLGVRI